MNFSISLFQQQSYMDAWETYTDLLKKRSTAGGWDYIILTASNESQAESYRHQIDHRLKLGRLPDETQYAVLPDPEGKRVGSGGATLNVLKYVREREGGFAGKKILVIHSGGDSKRVPQYSACGKLFSPVPRMLPDGRRSTLFDEFMIGMSGVASRIADGMLVCSGDVLLLFNPLQIDFYGKGAAALSIKENVETGKNHGVYLKDEEGNVGSFLHKQPVDRLTELGAVDSRRNVDIDTGAVIFHSSMLEDLYGLIDTQEKFRTFVNQEARLSFYADFLYPLASGSSLEQFYLEAPEGSFTHELQECRRAVWEVLHKYRMKLIRLSPASFIHFGTTGELLHLVNEEIGEYSYLGWTRQVNTNSVSPQYAGSNSYISIKSGVGEGSYIEDSYIYEGTQIGRNCVISGVSLRGQTIPDNVVMHGLKLEGGRFVVRMYGVKDNPKENRIFGRELPQALWDMPLYPVCGSIHDAVNATLQQYLNGFRLRPKGAVSLKESFRQADISAILPWQEKLGDCVRVESLLQVIDEKGDLEKGIQVFRDGISPKAERMLVEEAEKLKETRLEEFSRKIRIYDALSRIFDGEKKEVYSEACFASIRNAILEGAVQAVRYDAEAVIVRDEVLVELPVRVNWGGGWSDTPPYCMENGGTVLNAAVLLQGERPVKVTLRRLKEAKIVLASEDNGSYGEFTQLQPLQDSSNPFDPFALHKAALIACGIIPYEEKKELSAVLKQLRGGVYLSTQVVDIPRGSGLGTSSILAGACVKGLFEFIGRQITEDELYSRVLCMEQIMSTGGGWQDQVGGLTMGIKMVTSDVGMEQRITAAKLHMSQETLTELNERFCLIYTGQRRLARNLLRDVVGRYIGGSEEAVEVFYEIQRVAVLMRLELEKGHVDRFARLLSDHWELSKKMDSGCTNTCIDQIFLSIDDLICGRMICGAGGGGFLQVVLRKGVSRQQLKERLREVFQDSGVDVWECSLE